MLCTSVTATGNIQLLIILGHFQEKWFTKCLLRAEYFTGKDRWPKQIGLGLSIKFTTKASSPTTLFYLYLLPNL